MAQRQSIPTMSHEDAPSWRWPRWSALSIVLSVVAACGDEARLPDQSEGTSVSGRGDQGVDGGETVDDVAGADAAMDDDGTSRDGGADDGFDFDDCNRLCDELDVVGCDGEDRLCVRQCAVDVTALGGTRCMALWVDMIECGRLDLQSNFECDADGAPVLKEDVCIPEQVTLIECIRTGGQ